MRLLILALVFGLVCPQLALAEEVVDSQEQESSYKQPYVKGDYKNYRKRDYSKAGSRDASYREKKRYQKEGRAFTKDVSGQKEYRKRADGKERNYSGEKKQRYVKKDGSESYRSKRYPKDGKNWDKKKFDQEKQDLSNAEASVEATEDVVEGFQIQAQNPEVQVEIKPELERAE